MFESFAALLAACEAGGTVVRRDGRRRHPARVTAGPPASPEDLATLEGWLGHPLPADYRAFLERWDGAQLFAIQGPHGVDPNPSLFRARDVPERQFPFEDPRVLTIGMLDDEAYFLLDRRQTEAARWPVAWADEADTTEAALARQVIAGSFAEFVGRYAAAQGESYWEPPPPPLEWQAQPPERPLEERWVHGLGVGLTLDRHTILLYRLAFPDGSLYGVTPEALLLAVGLRARLLALGAQPVDPASLNWEPQPASWLFTFPTTPWPRLDPRAIPPAAPPRGWQELAPGLWVHGDGERADAALAVQRSLAHGNHIGTYSLGWRFGTGAAAAEPLRQRLPAFTHHGSAPKYLPEGYEAEQYHWWKADEPAPDVLP